MQPISCLDLGTLLRYLRPAQLKIFLGRSTLEESSNRRRACVVDESNADTTLSPWTMTKCAQQTIMSRSPVFEDDAFSITKRLPHRKLVRRKKDTFVKGVFVLLLIYPAHVILKAERT
jgi:hypothetical protein